MFIIFIPQQTSSGIIQISSTGLTPALIHNIHLDFGNSYILIVHKDWGCLISGVPAVRCFSPVKTGGEVQEAHGGAYEDTYTNI